jgi:uncharacterized peroxidase-related enzyme
MSQSAADRHPFPLLVDPATTTGDLREALEAVQGARGQVADIWWSMAYHAPLIRAHLAIYQALIFDRWGLTRRQCELLATVTSSVNGCRYCSMHHGAPLLQEGQDPAEVAALKVDPDGASLQNLGDDALRRLAVKLTRTPAEDHRPEMGRLAELGFTEAQRLQAVSVVAYFAMMNRIADGLDLPLEPDYLGSTR